MARRNEGNEMKHFAPASGDALQWLIARLLILIDTVSTLVIAGAVLRLF
jgi:hypothetical protein